MAVDFGLSVTIKDARNYCNDAISSITKDSQKDSEGYDPEPLNMQGAVGVLIALAGVLCFYKL